jgi:metal-responsive CopG/Arc/MetJ family transcriptional regulator
MPDKLIAIVNQEVERQDTDRSKFIRGAIREQLKKFGISLEAK